MISRTSLTSSIQISMSLQERREITAGKPIKTCRLYEYFTRGILTWVYHLLFGRDRTPFGWGNAICN
ncbi:hypothetical protein BDV36DRAFT_249369, partial [Aspergillus pseudocaelatus]